jgi:hypothetical protein
MLHLALRLREREENLEERWLALRNVTSTFECQTSTVILAWRKGYM